MIIIKNGALVTPQGLRRADLAMDGDKIVRIAAAIEPGEGDTVQDATDCWVFPGFIDTHSHMSSFSRCLNQVYCGASLGSIAAVQQAAGEGSV